MMRWFIVSLVLTLLAFAAAAALGWLWPGLFQERIPIHWNIDMQPDGWVSRSEFVWYLLIYPGVMALLVVMMGVLPLISPKNFEVEQFRNTWGYVFALLIAFFCYLFALQIGAALLDSPLDNTWFARLFVAGFFVLFALMGNVMGKCGAISGWAFAPRGRSPAKRSGCARTASPRGPGCPPASSAPCWRWRAYRSGSRSCC